MTEQSLAPFRGDVTPIDGWFVTAGHPLVQQRFYAALDGAGHLCWTDDALSAACFPTRRDAVRFARFSCPQEDWSVCQ